MIFRIYLFLIFRLFPADEEHAIYISVIEINENVISIKVFSDDLQDAVRNYTNETINISEKDFLVLYSDQIQNYFIRHFKLLINEKEQELILKKTRREGDASFLYFSIEKQPKWYNATIKAPYFMELFPDQSNVLTIHYNEEKYYSRLTKADDSFSITFR